MDNNELRAALEAILFVSNEPVKVEEFAEAFADADAETITLQLEEIKRSLESCIGGFILEQAAGGWRLATRPEHDSVLKKYFSKKGENRLSIAALETLAIVAYRQPITAPEVSDIRGVNSTQTIRTLLERRMIRVSGRKNVVGSPFLYRTTREFLVHFGLNDIRDLPQLEEFGDLIGEQLNEDLVANIAAADVTPDTSEIPLADGEEIGGDAIEVADDDGVAAEDRAEVELESSRVTESEQD
jgi:segregation and condensation protein B